MISSRSRKRRSNPYAGLAALLLAAVLAQGAAASPVFTSSSAPSSVNAGEPATVSVNITSDQPIFEVWITLNPSTPEYSYRRMNLTSGNETAGTWAYGIPAEPWSGTVEYFITATDDMGGSARYPASGIRTVEIIGEDPPKPFPWNIVIVVIFLGVVLVLTELIYKPGFYRPTGRERARMLEEEDREREESEKKN